MAPQGGYKANTGIMQQAKSEQVKSKSRAERVVLGDQVINQNMV